MTSEYYYDVKVIDKVILQIIQIELYIYACGIFKVQNLQVCVQKCQCIENIF